MKRILTIPLLFVYIIAVSGVMIQLHYCGQELESWQLFAENDGCMDDSCGDESTENDGCCKDELVVAKVSNDQNVAQQQVLKFINSDFHPLLPQSFSAAYTAKLVGQNELPEHNSNAPPGLWQNIPLYKLNANFTYYG